MAVWYAAALPAADGSHAMSRPSTLASLSQTSYAVDDASWTPMWPGCWDAYIAFGFNAKSVCCDDALVLQITEPPSSVGIAKLITVS